MRGADLLLRSLAESGVEICFANPGTSEMHLVAAFDTVSSLRPVLTLHESVAIAPGGPSAAATAARPQSPAACAEGIVSTQADTVRASAAMSLASGGSLAT